jgi:NAD(P)-dependent dehydrogenase (short-subunit alcohol dehydrogenase family)
MQELAGRVAVVTGAGSGIGRALARRLGAEGMAVAVADVEEGALRAVESDLSERDVSVLARVVDVSDQASVDGLAAAVFAELGGAHVLCNNAGVFAGGYVWDRPLEDYRWVLGVNLWGVLHGIRAFVPRMIEAGEEGHVVNTVSAAGLFGSGFSAAYNISKFGAFAATESLASDLAAVGAPIGVTAFCPGAVDTGIATSDRNRPADLPTRETPDAEFVTAALRDTTGRGMDAAAAAEMVIDAIRTSRFLLLTSDGYARSLARRAEELREGRLPSLPEFE